MAVSQDRIVYLVKRVLFFDHFLLEWTLRVLLTINILSPGFPFADHSYPLDVLALTVVGYWLSVARLKLLALLPYGFALFINYLHLTGVYGHHEG